MAKGISNLFSTVMAKAVTKPETKHIDRMILPSSTQNYSQTYFRLCGSREKNQKV